jgi:hypothetical protein
MLVYNLTEQPLTYRKRSIPANGGSFNFRDLRVVPLRDQKLAQGPNAVLAFGSLPAWYLAKQEQKAKAHMAARAQAKASPPPAMAAAPVKKAPAATPPTPPADPAPAKS